MVMCVVWIKYRIKHRISCFWLLLFSPDYDREINSHKIHKKNIKLFCCWISKGKGNYKPRTATISFNEPKVSSSSKKYVEQTENERNKTNERKKKKPHWMRVKRSHVLNRYCSLNFFFGFGSVRCLNRYLMWSSCLHQNVINCLAIRHHATHAHTSPDTLAVCFSRGND